MHIAGIDEAGRGPLAGPVTAAAVIFGDVIPSGVKDSKKCSPAKRIKLFQEIQDTALAYAIVFVEHDEIDRINILQATFLAMQLAVKQLKITPDHILVDGNQVPQFGIKTTAIIKGDETEPVISAASILAKVARDEKMIVLDGLYPQYGFVQHKGYGTKAHFAAIKQFGLCPIHRRSFLKNYKETNPA